MENEKSTKSKFQINYEKVGLYIACVGFLFLFWQTQMIMSDKISDLKERIAKLEVKVEYLETNHE